MRIGIQSSRKPEHFAGAATFEQELFNGLMDCLASVEHTLVIFSTHARPTALPNGEKIEWVRVSHVALRNLAANVRRVVNLFCNHVLRFPSPFRNEHWIDVYLYKAKVEFFLNLTPETIPTEVPYMSFIWDLMHRGLPFFPECSQKGAWVRRELHLGAMIRRAALIGTSSWEGREEIAKFYQVSPERIHVLPYPTPRFAFEQGALAGTDSMRDNASDYIFYPASFHAHKDHVTLLRALAILRDRHGIKLMLNLSGGDWGNQPHVREQVRKLGLELQVNFLGFVSREKLVSLYKGAVALVFPSLLGPGNIPPLEALALGCPAIVADILGAAEQMEGSSLLFPAGDEFALAEAILKVKNDSAFRAELIERGRKRAEKYTSKDIGRATLQIISSFERIRRCWSNENRYPSRYNIARLFKA